MPTREVAALSKPGVEPEVKPEPEPEPAPEHPRSLLDATAALVRGEALPAGLHHVAMEAVVRDDWCDPNAPQLRVAMPGEAVVVLERRVTPAGRSRVRLATGGWASLVASDGTVLLEEIASTLAFHRTPECSDETPLPSASSLTHGKRYYLESGLRVVRTQSDILLLIADGSEPVEVEFHADTTESVRDDAWQLERRQERTTDDVAPVRVSGVAKLRGLGVQAADAVSRIAFDRRTEAENTTSTVSRLDQLLQYDAAAASLDVAAPSSSMAAAPEEQPVAIGALNTSVYVVHRPSVVTRMLLASNVDLIDKQSLAAAAADINEHQHAIGGTMM